MFIRKIERNNKTSGKMHHEYRLVESVRTADGKVKQDLLLNLGRHFNFPQEKWKLLSNRIDQIIQGQMELFVEDEAIESSARRLAQLVLKKRGEATPMMQKSSAAEACFETVDVNNIHVHDNKTIGCEYLTYETLMRLEFDKKLSDLGFSKNQINATFTQIIGRLTSPGSERATYEWYRERSGLDELLDIDNNESSLDQLYRIGDKLLTHKTSLENSLYQKERDLFNLTDTITLYDLTNTYFEVSGKYNDKAAFGRSKEKRSDCRLVTLGLVLDGNGFPKKSEIFSGNVGEPTTLKSILKKLHNSTTKPTLIFDAGIASQENIDYIKAQGHDYIVVSRKRRKAMPEGETIIVKEKGEDIIEVKKVINAATGEIELYCYSQRKSEKEQSMKDQAATRYEDGLLKLNAGLKKKNGTKDPEKIQGRLGRLHEKHKAAAKHYDINVTKDDAGKKVIEITWQRKEDETQAGVYCLRTSRSDLDEKSIWQTYVMLTDVEAAFRSMKTELGMRPVFHQKTERVDAHLFITLLAYHVLHTIRYELNQKDIHLSWDTIRARMSTQIRITNTMKSEDGRTIHVRKSTVPTAFQQKIYNALSLSYYPAANIKTVI